MIKPSYDRLLVEPMDVEERTMSGLVLPTGTNVKLCKGKVLDRGRGHLMPDYKFRDCEHQVGDVILYYKHDAMPIFMGKEYHILKDNMPFGVVDESDTII